MQNQTTDKKASERQPVESTQIEWNKGDVLEISAHHSEKGKGLSYPDMTVPALESGTSGGWDVYDGQLENWTQVSFYGFSVI